jgi:hypothetical protein
VHPHLPPISALLSLASASPSSSNTRGDDSLDSPTSPSTSTSHRFAFSASPPPPSLYPSLSSLSSSVPPSGGRPVSAGGVERLTHRVHKLRLPSRSDSTGSSSSTVSPPLGGPEESIHHPLEDEADLSATSDEDSDADSNATERERRSRHKDKKSRVASPEPLVAVKLEDDEEEDVKPTIPSAAEAEEQAKATLVARRRATLVYLITYVNATYRAGLAKKGMKEMRKAIKSPAVGGSGLKAEVK